MAVAEERHFRRAAERLGMTQPPLSILIQVLEQEIGTLLLRRTRRSVELTEAGALFLAEARDVLERAQRAIKVARDVEQGNAGRLEVGFTDSCAFNPVLCRLFRAFRERYPQIDLILTEQNTLALFEAVRDRKLDAAFLRPPVDEAEEVVVEPMLDEADGRGASCGPRAGVRAGAPADCAQKRDDPAQAAPCRNRAGRRDRGRVPGCGFRPLSGGSQRLR